MSTKLKKKRPKIHYIEEPDPDKEYVTRAEYIRRRHKLDLEKDPQASPLFHLNIQKAIDTGIIPIYKQGDDVFIEWERSKNVFFKRNGQRPKPKVKKK